jgi:hypothetical protein
MKARRRVHCCVVCVVLLRQKSRLMFLNLHFLMILLTLGISVWVYPATIQDTLDGREEVVGSPPFQLHAGHWLNHLLLNG